MASTRSRAGLRAFALLGLAASTTALPPLGNFNYQGCYTNDHDDAALKSKVVTDPALTLPKCAATCDGYPWFGVQAGTVCYCGTALATSAEKRPDTECAVRCAGNRCQLCGDTERINVFWTGEDATASLSAEPTSSEEQPSESTTTVQPSASITTTNEPPIESTAMEESLSSTATTEQPAVESTATVEAPATTASTEAQTTITEQTPTITEAPTVPPTECEITTTLLPTPNPCWASMPTFCTSLNNDALPYPAYTIVASRCSTVMVDAQFTLPAALSSCFQGYSRPNWTPTSAYSCVATADVYCRATTVCKEDAATPTATAYYQNALVANGGLPGFEDGKLWETPFGSNSGETVIQVGVSDLVSHEGQYALKVDFLNVSGGSRGWVKYITLDPGAEYVASWWWWSDNAQANTVSRMQFTGGGGVSFLKDASTMGMPARQWVKAEQRFTAAASFARVFFSVYGNSGNARNTFYVDDISITRA